MTLPDRSSWRGYRGEGAGLIRVELSVVEEGYHDVIEVLGGAQVTEVASRYGVLGKAVSTWLGRYREGVLAGLAEPVAPTPGASVAAGRGGRGVAGAAAHGSSAVGRRFGARAGPGRSRACAVTVDGVPGAGAPPPGRGAAEEAASGGLRSVTRQPEKGKT